MNLSVKKASTPPHSKGGALTAVACACVLAGVSASMSAHGQTTDSDAPLDEFPTIGSRLLSRQNPAATSLLSVEGVEMETRGNIRVEDFLNVLPQVFADQAAETLYRATGTGTLNLRGLGAQRTLVLIDGRRLPYGSSSSAAANLDLIPAPLIERVDLLTGGASAVHGSDAIGGVANFVLKRNFQGFEVGGQWGAARSANDEGFFAGVLNAAGRPVPGSEVDGEEAQIYALLGINTSDNRGNLTLYAGFEDRAEILQTDRIFSACPLRQDAGPLSSENFEGFGCAGSANFRLFGGPGGFAFLQENGTLDNFFTLSDSVRTFNFANDADLQRPAERYNVHVKGYYQLAPSIGSFENVEAFADISYVNNSTNTQLAPTASFGIGTYSINCDNPLIQNSAGVSFLDTFGCAPADVAAGTIVSGITASHRNVEGGPRSTLLENSTLRLVGGLRGSFARHWQWEAFAQYADSSDERVQTNDFITANVQQALLVTTDANGNAVCTDTSGGCVPYNIFQRGPNGESLVTQEALNFISGTARIDGSTSQSMIGANVQASLEHYGVQLPWAEQSVAVLLGFEFRNDELSSSPDARSRAGGGLAGITETGFVFDRGDESALPVAGEIDVTEFYTEIEVPVLANRSLARELSVGAQYRYSDFAGQGNGTSSDFDASTYGFSLAWQPLHSVSVRAQYQRAMRSPNVLELYTARGTGLGSQGALPVSVGAQQFDPCATATPLLSLEDCQRSGVTAAQYGNIEDVVGGTVQILSGGNPGLAAELADTLTVGMTWSPRFAPNLTVGLDYFNILVGNAISPASSPARTLETCLRTGEAQFCDLITRDSSGSLAAGTPGVGIVQAQLNVAETETTGMDVQVSYGLDLGAHALKLNYSATLLDQLETSAFVGATALACAGKFGLDCGAPSPEYRHRAVIIWATPWRVDLIGTWRHFGETDLRVDTTQPLLESQLDSVHYIDVAATWRVTDALTVRGTALNLFGEVPPLNTFIEPTFGGGNTYPTIYDVSTMFVASFEYSF